MAFVGPVLTGGLGRPKQSVDASTKSPAMCAQRPEKHGAGMQKVSVANDATVAALGCKVWPMWGCEASKFPWTYEETEVCYLLKGNVVVTDDKTGEQMAVSAGDVALFPGGMSCTWDVSEAVSKHYSFGSDLSALPQE